MTGTIGVLVVEDHPLMRDTTARFIGSAEGMRVVDAVASAEEAIVRADSEEVDVIVLDLRLPGRGGIESMGSLRSRYPTARIVILTMLESDDVRARAGAMGASGFLTKGCAPDDLIQTVRRVEAGERVGFDPAPTVTAPGAERLDAGEVAVLRRLIDSRSVVQIADDLGLTLRAVTALVGRVRSKTGASTRAEWLDYALRHELL